MPRISLKEFIAEKGQTGAAPLLGVTQGALSKALRVGRDIYVVISPDGSCKAEEIKPFPAQPKSQVA